MSANLWAGGAHPDAFAELVDRLDVDVVAVQEIRPSQAEALLDVMPHGSLFVGANDGGVAIAMRRPGDVESVPMPYRDSHVTVLDPSVWPELAAPIHVTAMHLMAPHSVTPWPSLVLRPKQLRAIEQHLHNTRHRAAQRIVLGDFNATPLWPAYRRIATHLTDAAVAFAEARGTEPARTWGPWPGSPRLLRIDHAFVSGLEVEAFETVHVPGSDHSAIVLDVAAGAGAGAGTRDVVAVASLGPSA